MFRDGRADFKINRITGAELMGMRLLRGKSREEMAEVCNESVEFIKWTENNEHDPADPICTKKYMKHLSCNMNHVEQFRRIIDGKQFDFTEERTMPSKIKKQVYKRDNNQCTNCGSKEDLHIHHIKEYSKGGLNNLENLTLLCVSCHANVHKDNVAYSMLKFASEVRN